MRCSFSSLSNKLIEPSELVGLPVLFLNFLASSLHITNTVLHPQNVHSNLSLTVTGLSFIVTMIIDKMYI